MQEFGGCTALMSAAEGGHYNAVEELLDAGAAVNIKGGCLGESTALHRAAQAGHYRIVQLLLKADAGSKDIQDSDGCTALMLAAGKGHSHVVIVRVLLEAGANVNIQSYKRDETNLFVRGDRTTALHEAVRKECILTVQLLLDAKADVHAVRLGGDTALLLGASLGSHPTIMQALLKAGANVHAVNSMGWTALMEAAFRKNYVVVRLLLDAGADSNARNYIHNTALKLAIGRKRDLGKLFETVDCILNYHSLKRASLISQHILPELTSIVQDYTPLMVNVDEQDSKKRDDSFNGGSKG